MGVDQSSVSRLESGELNAEQEEVQRYLAALETEEADEYAAYLESEWEFFEKPSFWHPQRRELELADETMVGLRDFVLDPHLPEPVLEQAKMYLDGLHRAASYLEDVKHNIAFFGNIMVGKTTALCFLGDLLMGEVAADSRAIKQRAVLEAGAGWTTLCEVQINTMDLQSGGAGTFGLIMQPHSNDEVFRLVSDFCASFLELRSGAERENRISPEVERALRAMANLTRKTTRSPDGKVEHHDPLLELANGCASSEKLTAEFFARIKTHERTSCQLWFEAANYREGLAWLQKTFKEINNGRNPKVSLPKRIDIFIPVQLMQESPYQVNFIDTKGVDGRAIRPDLQVYLDDPRTLIVLCSRFAPDASMLALLDHLVATGKGNVISERLVFLVLPRSDEALALNDDDGTPVESAEEAYSLREAQIRSRLAKYLGGDTMPILFFDATCDDPTPIADCLQEKLDALRFSYATRVGEITVAIEDLIAHHAQQQVKAALNKVHARLGEYLEAHRELPSRTMPVHARLIEALKYSHPRTVWSSARRNGDWANLDIYHYLGIGANMDVRQRSDPGFAALGVIIDELLRDPECEVIRRYLEELKKNASIWRLNFLAEVSNRSQEIFRAVLFPDDALWNQCKGLWEQGNGFGPNVLAKIEAWCEADKHKWIEEAVEGIIIKDWQELFLLPLQTLRGKATGAK